MVKRRLLVVGVLTALAVGAGSVLARGSASPRPTAVAAPGARAGSEEATDGGQLAADRAAALSAATAAGRFGKVAPTTQPTSGWLGSQVLDPATDDWEPAVATDPAAPYVYLLTTRFGVAPPGCSAKCPAPFIAITTSSDGGASFGPQTALCICLGSKNQYDPVIEVAPNTGAVYAAFLNGDRHAGFSTVFTKSTDHGKTWSAPVHVYGNVSWTDKPELATSASGKDVYISWNGPTGGDLYVSVSHDYGATWTPVQVTDSGRYYYAYDGRVLADGTVVFSESSLDYQGATNLQGEAWHHAIISRNGGATWENVVVAKVPLGETCIADGCKPDFYEGQTSVVSDAPNHLAFAYEGPSTAGGPQRVYVSTSSDEGRTWSAGTPLSVSGEDATGPRLASYGGDLRVWYMQTADGDNPDAWNVWYRTSTNDGHSWSTPVKLDDAPAGAAGYVGADGFDEIYGDYGEIGVTNAGKTIATWGEGFSYTGPGGTWFNVQR
jgi:hypothetical protein